MLRFLLILMLTPLCSFVMNAQQISASILNAQDTVFVELNEKNQIIYTHEVQAKQTIYKLARTFGCDPTDIFDLNRIARDSVIAIGQELKVPLSAKYLDKKVSNSSANSIPVVYKVKKSETLYSIAKKYFYQPIENIIARNQLADFTLSIGQNLLVGYLSFDLNNEFIPVKENRSRSMIDHATLIDSWQAEGVKPKTVRNDNIDSKFVMIVEPRVDSITGLQEGLIDRSDLYEELVPVRSRGIAKWDKNGRDLTNLFVMHRDAKINSIIEIRNPMNNRSVQARVVGHIQAKMVTDDIKVILSPAVAKNLGILDKRAQVEMTYFEE